MSTLKALLFDVDGTLADTERDGHRVAFNRAFADCGLNWHWGVSLYGRLLQVSGGKERLRFYIQNWQPEMDSSFETDGLIFELHQAKTRYYLELMTAGLIPLRPGVERLLGEARSAGIRLAVATTTTPENVIALLSATLGEQSFGWFDVIAAGDCVPDKKPAPDIYFLALEKLGLDADECLALEDSDNGVKSSTGAGIKTLVTVNEYTRDQDFTGAAAVLSQLGEPDNGFEVLAGYTGPASYVNLAFLQSLFVRPKSLTGSGVIP
ncbi:HAD family hydrolase [Pseudomonadota bacterium]